MSKKVTMTKLHFKLFPLAAVFFCGLVSAQAEPPNIWSDISKDAQVARISAQDLTLAPKIESKTELKSEFQKEKIPHSIAVTELSFAKNIAERKIQESFESDEFGVTKSEKTISVRRLTEYLELRGLTGGIRAALLKEGLPVIEAGSGIAIAEGDERATLFDLKRRIAQGEFNHAEFVLIGTLVDFAPILRQSVIPSAGSTLYEWGLELVVDFKLINTETLQIRSAFTATGVGVEKRLVSLSTSTAAQLTPRRAKIVSDLASSLALNTSRLLADQGVLLGQDKDASSDARLDNQKYTPYIDKNVRVYK
jgi:hypothetical protein